VQLLQSISISINRFCYQYMHHHSVSGMGSQQFRMPNDTIDF